MSKTAVSTGIRLQAEEQAAIDALARAHNISFNHMVRLLLREGLKQYDLAAQLPPLLDHRAKGLRKKPTFWKTHLTEAK